MRIYDISLPISNELPCWPDDPAIELTRLSDTAKGDVATVSHLSSTVHIGTHVDAPAHFVPGGAGVDQLDLNVLIGLCHVVHMPDTDVIDSALLDQLSIPAGTTRLLLRTRNSDLWERGESRFQEDYVAVDHSGAAWLVEHGIQLVGVDYLSVAPFTDTFRTHDILLREEVILLEGINLSGVEPGDYHLVCLPLKVRNADGAPARAVLIGDE